MTESPGWNQGPGDGPPPPPYGYAPFPPDHPQSVTVLVLGILSLLFCQLLGPVAWVMGHRAVREIDEAQGRLGGRSQAQLGMVLGIVGTALLGLALVGLVLFFALFAVSAVSVSGR